MQSRVPLGPGKFHVVVLVLGGNVFSTSQKRPADPEKTEKGKLIV